MTKYGNKSAPCRCHGRCGRHRSRHRLLLWWRGCITTSSSRAARVALSCCERNSGCNLLSSNPLPCLLDSAVAAAMAAATSPTCLILLVSILSPGFLFLVSFAVVSPQLRKEASPPRVPRSLRLCTPCAHASPLPEYSSGTTPGSPRMPAPHLLSRPLPSLVYEALPS